MGRLVQPPPVDGAAGYIPPGRVRGQLPSTNALVRPRPSGLKPTGPAIPGAIQEALRQSMSDAGGGTRARGAADASLDLNGMCAMATKNAGKPALALLAHLDIDSTARRPSAPGKVPRCAWWPNGSCPGDASWRDARRCTRSSDTTEPVALLGGILAACSSGPSWSCAARLRRVGGPGAAQQTPGRQCRHLRRGPHLRGRPRRPARRLGQPRHQPPDARPRAGHPALARAAEASRHASPSELPPACHQAATRAGGAGRCSVTPAGSSRIGVSLALQLVAKSAARAAPPRSSGWKGRVALVFGARVRPRSAARRAGARRCPRITPLVGVEAERTVAAGRPARRHRQTSPPRCGSRAGSWCRAAR